MVNSRLKGSRSTSQWPESELPLAQFVRLHSSKSQPLDKKLFEDFSENRQESNGSVRVEVGVVSLAGFGDDFYLGFLPLSGEVL